jgi:hypothetical protein
MACGQADGWVTSRGTTFEVAKCRVFHLTSPTRTGLPYLRRLTIGRQRACSTHIRLAWSIDTMNSQRARTVTLITLALLLPTAFPTSVFADTYSLGAVKSTQSEGFAGGDNYGNYTPAALFSNPKENASPVQE